MSKIKGSIEELVAKYLVNSILSPSGGEIEDKSNFLNSFYWL